VKKATKLTEVTFKQSIARLFSAFHKECFDKGPRHVAVTILGNYIIVIADCVLNKFENALREIQGGSKMVINTRKLLLGEITERYRETIERDFNFKVKEIKNQLDVYADKLVCTIVLENSLEE